MRDAETGEVFETAFDDEARERYAAAFDAYALTIQKAGLRNGGRYVRLPTSTPFEEAIFGPLVRAGAVQ